MNAEPSIFVILVPDVTERRSYLKEVGNLDDSPTFYNQALGLLQSGYLGRSLNENERESMLTYLKRIW